jgi:DNA ligase (NAD+)
VKLKQYDLNESREIRTESSYSPLLGKTVVFTGSLPDGMSRTVAQSLAVDVLGAKATPSSVSSSTGVVIIGEKGGKKATQAKELGIATMTADEFIELVNRFNKLK